MGSRADRHTDEREALLRDGLAEVCAELRLIDPADLIVFARMDLHPNIGDLVNSSLELYFTENTVRYGWVATAEASWSDPPVLMFDMEFRHAGVTAFFKLTLRGEATEVELHHIAFDHPGDEPSENTARLAAAIADARAPKALEHAARILAGTMPPAEAPLPGRRRA
jgi:hypothetical protein